MSLRKLILLLTMTTVAFGCGDDSSPTDSGGSNNSSGDIVILEGEIAADRTLKSSEGYLLRGAVFVRTGATLTIESGTTIFGESVGNPPGTLIIAQGAKIMAEGTAEEPIVFTSDQVEGARSRGDWGGLIINGRAPLNTGTTAQGEGNTGTYGGSDPDDNSGVLRYVRVEFAGQEFSPDNELNGIAFQGVGRGTTVEYVQVHYNQDDGIEFFGGTVDAKYVLCTGVRDDSFDWTDGWSGRGQFWIAQQNGADADNGIEADNNGTNNDLTPRSNPTLYNLTIIGDPNGPESDTGLLLREGTAGTIRNAIVLGFNKGGVDVATAATASQAASGALSLRHSIFFDNRIAGANSNFPTDTDEIDEVSWMMTEGFENHTLDPALVGPYDLIAPGFAPGASSPAVDGSVPVATPPVDGFFTVVDFIGAMDSGAGADWTAGWTTSAQN